MTNQTPAAYETAVKRRESKTYIETILEENKKRQKQEIAAQKAFLGPAYEGTPENERNEIVSVIASDPERARRYLTDNLERLNEEARDAKDLEAIIDSAPLEVLSESLFLIDYNENARNKKLRDYSVLLKMQYKIAETNEAVRKGQKREGDLQKLQNDAIKLAMERFKREHSNIKDQYTRNFLIEFADEIVKADDEIAIKYALNKFTEYVKEARDYVTKKENSNELRKYLKTDITKEDRPILYDAITRPFAQAA